MSNSLLSDHVLNEHGRCRGRTKVSLTRQTKENSNMCKELSPRESPCPSTPWRPRRFLGAGPISLAIAAIAREDFPPEKRIPSSHASQINMNDNKWWSNFSDSKAHNPYAFARRKQRLEICTGLVFLSKEWVGKCDQLFISNLCGGRSE